MRNVRQSARPSQADAMRSFVSWLEDTDAEIEPHYGYSGRGQFGATCFGLVGDLAEIQSALLDFALSDPGMGEAIREIVKRQCFDNMGLDMIMYFPGVDIEPPGAQ